jgi:hypothetical protein
MIMYKLTKNSDGQVAGVINLETFGQIPFDPANTDYANFKKDLANGAELQDSEGVVMTAEQVNQFIETLA